MERCFGASTTTKKTTTTTKKHHVFISATVMLLMSDIRVPEPWQWPPFQWRCCHWGWGCGGLCCAAWLWPVLSHQGDWCHSGACEPPPGCLSTAKTNCYCTITLTAQTQRTAETDSYIFDKLRWRSRITDRMSWMVIKSSEISVWS